jgi:tetratricopeptide (TPR) repeat protein
MYPYIAFILRRQGKWSETIKNLKYGLQLDPLNARSVNELANTYELMHQYDNQIGIARQGLLLIPDYKVFNNHVFKAYFNKTADLKMSLKESGLAEEDIQSTIYYYSRQYDKLLGLTMKDSTIETSQFDYLPKTYNIALIYYLSGNPSLCKIYADSAIVHLKEKIKEDPNDDRYYATIGKCYALIGNNQEAINCGKKAVNLKPMKLDAWQGVIKEQDLMEIYIFTGNYDLAMDKIENLLSIPSGLHKSNLSINPIYDPLRDLPRFQKILKTEYKIKYQ